MSGRRTYTLFPTVSGFSNQTFDYRGTKYVLVATSVRQAYALAHRGTWVTGPAGVGIVGIYTRERGWRLWDGCEGHVGFELKHGVGPRAVKEAMAEHQAAHVGS